MFLPTESNRSHWVQKKYVRVSKVVVLVVAYSKGSRSRSIGRGRGRGKEVLMRLGRWKMGEVLVRVGRWKMGRREGTSMFERGVRLHGAYF